MLSAGNPVKRCVHRKISVMTVNPAVTAKIFLFSSVEAKPEIKSKENRTPTTKRTAMPTETKDGKTNTTMTIRKRKADGPRSVAQKRKHACQTLCIIEARHALCG